MISTLILALCLQVPAPKVSVLGKAKPWWERIKPGDEFRLYAPPDTMIPLVRLWEYSEKTGVMRREANYLAFEDVVFGDHPDGVSLLWDEKRLWFARNRHWVRILRIHDTWPPGPNGTKLKTPVAEVLADLNGYPVKDADAGKPENMFAIPVAYLGTPDQPRHPDFDRLPLMMWASGKPGVVTTPYAEVERAWKERRRRSEEIKRRGEEEARRQAGRKK